MITDMRRCHFTLRFYRAWATLAVAALITSCGHSDSADSTRAVTAAYTLRPALSCDAYKSYVTDTLVARFTDFYAFIDNPGGPITVSVGTGGSSPPSNGQTENAPPDHVSGTNNQEADVDEADLVKTGANGTLYIAHQKYLLIEQGFPAQDLRELSRTDLGHDVHTLHLDDAAQRLVALGYGPKPGTPAEGPSSYGLQLTFIDVSDLTNPTVTQRLWIEGYIKSSRHMERRLHTLVATQIELPASLGTDPKFAALISDYYQAVQQQGKESDAAKKIKVAIADLIRMGVDNSSIDEFLPHAVQQRGAEIIPVTLTSCGDIQRPDVTPYPGLLTLMSMDILGNDLAAATIAADGHYVYASKQNIYVATPFYDAQNTSTQKTALHKFSIAQKIPAYIASGAIDGFPEDELGFSEFEGHLRVVTTQFVLDSDINTWSTANGLYVLRDANDGNLAIAGAVTGFGKGERVFSTRFMEGRGFVVTFRRIDPLFAFDLSDPTQPKLAGELEIPGFSDYMHPIDDQHLLTLGRAGTATGASNDLQLQIFDVTNLAQPVLLHSFIPSDLGDYSSSMAQYDPHAFTFDASSGMLAIPLTYSDATRNRYFNGFAAFNINITKGISDLARIDHADLAQPTACPPPPSTIPCAGYGGPYVHPLRNVVMTQNAERFWYTLSTAGIKTIDLADPKTTLSRVIFPTSSVTDPGPIIPLASQ